MNEFDEINNSVEPENTPEEPISEPAQDIAAEAESASQDAAPEIENDSAAKAATEENAPSQGENGYNFNPDGTYRYVNPNQQGSFSGNAPQNNGYPYGNPQQTNSFRDGSQQQNNGYPYGNAQPNNVNPYSNPGQNNGYPYGNGQQGGRPNYQNGPVNGNNYYPYSNSTAQSPDGNGGKKSSGKAFKIIAGICGGALLLIIISIVVLVATNDSTPSLPETTTGVSNVDEVETSPSPSASDNKPSASADGELTAKEVYQKIAPSSVGVIVYEQGSREVAGEGSGVLIKEDQNKEYTYIITCAHVVEDASSVVVQLYDDTEYKAEIIGSDSRTDIAVLRIKASGLTLADIGDSEKLVVGDAVYAIGNPGGTSFAGSFTNGMVSALDRPINSNASGYSMLCIQHTATINPGNSGGALVNSYGQLIGINSRKIVAEDYEGMGFSVPSSVFVDVVNNIIANGYVANRAKLGITYVAASEYTSYGMFVAMKELPAGSLVIYSISSDSDLNNTKVTKGDMIIAVNGNELDDSSVLASVVENGSVGDKLTLTIVRINEDYSSDQFDVVVSLVEDKPTTETEDTTESDRSSIEDYYRDYFGNSFD